jgi:hypothetical protein
MRNFTLGAGLAAAMLAAGCERTPTVPTPPLVLAPASAATEEPFAVLELFTSEGCSSCPAADETLASITEHAEQAGQRVFTLELHVDYWDDLGWVDPFSARAYSERQQAYAKRLGLPSLYTPQLIVNGRQQMVGSRRAEADAAVTKALATGASLHVDARAQTGAVPGEVRVDYRVAGCPHVCELTVALVQDRAETRVARGENALRTLKHRHVVRALSTRALAGDGQGTLVARWPDPGARPAEVVTFVSDAASGAVLGARSTTIDRS